MTNCGENGRKLNLEIRYLLLAKFQILLKVLSSIIILLCCSVSFSQERILSGIIKDSLNNTFEGVNIIATPAKDNADIKFAISDHLGRYKLILDQGDYKIAVSYLGYKDVVLNIAANTDIKKYDFTLQQTELALETVVLEFDYKPIIVKKDTLIYDVNAFAKGNERKMKDLLEKLPGVKVDKDGEITVQGKKVTTMMVEGKSFFGGNSKLAVENIPADALNKIEVIDNYNEVSFLKGLTNREDVAMNVKLKEDKKKFLFGDIDAGSGVGDEDEGHYLVHGALFYYSPKTSANFIGDINNIGKSAFSYDDLVRFQGRKSDLLTTNRVSDNLFMFTLDDREVLKSSSKFSAMNFRQAITGKLDFESYAIYSNTITSNYSKIENQYLENDEITYENKTRDENFKTDLLLLSSRIDYSPNTFEKIFYNFTFQASNFDFNSNNLSYRSDESRLLIFNTNKEAKNISLKNLVEWHKQFKNIKHTTTYLFDYTFERKTPDSRWLTNSDFLEGLIPLQPAQLYDIRQLKKAEKNYFNALGKHYWSVNNANHLYSTIGANYEYSILTTSESQFLDNEQENEFSFNGFGNDLTYNLTDIYAGIEYKFRIGKLIGKPSLFVHFYNLATNQTSGEYSITKNMLEPQLYGEYEFNSAESLKLKYKLTNEFPGASLLAERYMLQDYNSVFKGNALLSNESFHSANLNYMKASMYRNLMLFSNASFIRKTRTLRNLIYLDGIDQITTPLITGNPETTWRVSGGIDKKFYKFRVIFNTNLNWFTYVQTLNGVTTKNSQNRQNIGINLKTTTKKWPTLDFGYNKSFSQFTGLTKSTFQTDTFTFDLDFDLIKNFTLKTDYSLTFNQNDNAANNNYTIANASLLYHKDKSPFTFELTAQNYLNNRKIINNYFSDYLISNQEIYILPRIVMLSISYKL